jgi:hypothetical protein
VAVGLRSELLAAGAMPPAGSWPPPYAAPQPHELPIVGVEWPPTADQLDYAQKLMTVALLGLALPALLIALVRNPGRLATGLARKHVG